jgi:hypothetical protein
VITPPEPATLRGAVPIPSGPVRYRRTTDELIATRGSGRKPVIQLEPAAPPAAPAPAQPTPRRTSVPVRHGTTTGYGRGCRCDQCKTAKAQADATYRARVQPAVVRGDVQPAVVRGDVQHGTTHGYAKGCRCDDCRAAKAKVNHAYKARRRARNRGTSWPLV